MIPIIVIGDVHGSYDQLARLLDSNFHESRTTVFVGDLIDRGPQSAKVIDLVMQFSERSVEKTHVLRGNHEQALIDFLNGNDHTTFLKNGGLSTIASYYSDVPENIMQAFRRDYPESHRDFLHRSKTHFETNDVLISHMGYDPQRPFSRDLAAMALEPHYEMFRPFTLTPVPLVVCGHYAQQTGVPYVSDSLICIDTGCGTSATAPLTALLLPERAIVQSDSEGNVK